MRYLQRHLVAIGQAMRAGGGRARVLRVVPKPDNFEWAEGCASASASCTWTTTPRQSPTRRTTPSRSEGADGRRRQVSGRFS